MVESFCVWDVNAYLGVEGLRWRNWKCSLSGLLTDVQFEHQGVQLWLALLITL